MAAVGKKTRMEEKNIKKKTLSNTVLRVRRGVAAGICDVDDKVESSGWLGFQINQGEGEMRERRWRVRPKNQGQHE